MPRTDGSGEKPDFVPLFQEGIAHFNSGEFWEAHESWEQLWLAADSDLHEFLQGLIQLAAAYHHVKRGTYRGAVRLFEAALRRLAPFPLDFCGAGRGEAEAAARELRRQLTEGPNPVHPVFPKLHPSDSPQPPLEMW